jgi:hypothetical protein
MGQIDRDAIRRRLDEVGALHARLTQDWADYKAALADTVRAADEVGLPLWEIAERTRRHRNYVAPWTTTKRRPPSRT